MLDKNGYRPNVGIILLNRDKQVFWGKRIREQAWQFPQGGIKAGESPEQAMFRELHEEVGLSARHVEIIGRTRDWLHYNVPTRWVRREWRGHYRGQKQIWFILRLVAEDSAISLEAVDHPEFDAWRWSDYWSPLDAVIEFKRAVYLKALTELSTLAGLPPRPEGAPALPEPLRSPGPRSAPPARGGQAARNGRGASRGRNGSPSADAPRNAGARSAPPPAGRTAAASPGTGASGNGRPATGSTGSRHGNGNGKPAARASQTRPAAKPGNRQAAAASRGRVEGRPAREDAAAEPASTGSRPPSKATGNRRTTPAGTGTSSATGAGAGAGAGKTAPKPGGSRPSATAGPASSSGRDRPHSRPAGGNVDSPDPRPTSLPEPPARPRVKPPRAPR